MGKIVRTISRDGMVMCCAVDSTDAVARMEQIHKTSAVVTAAEGRLLTAASIMGTMLKSANDSVTLRVEGNGPVGMLIAWQSDCRNSAQAIRQAGCFGCSRRGWLFICHQRYGYEGTIRRSGSNCFRRDC